MKAKPETQPLEISRRAMLGGLLGAAAAAALSPLDLVAGPSAAPVTREIPSSGEAIPVVGMGTWKTFNVGADPELRDARAEVLAALFEEGGRLVDSSPMYGTSREVVGYGLEKLKKGGEVFAADKVWTSDGGKTGAQTSASRAKWNVESLDLMQVHNLVAWESHLPALAEMKKRGRIRYIGVTTSHGRRHGELEKIMENESIDFVQLTYNLVDRDVESRLLPLARDRGIAVIANRPFRGGELVDRMQRSDHPLPEWAGEIGCENWPQFLLKFIVSHPSVTCAIPATTRVEHMRENMGAARGDLPDGEMRAEMVRYVDSL